MVRHCKHVVLLLTATTHQQDVLSSLVGIYTSSKTENVKATTASTLSRLLRSSPGLLPAFLDGWGPKLLLQGEVGRAALCVAWLAWLRHAAGAACSECMHRLHTRGTTHDHSAMMCRWLCCLG